MKILYHHRIASKDGQYVHVEEMINAFRNLGHEVKIVAPSVTEDSNFGSEGGIVSVLKKYMPKVVYEILEFAYAFHAYNKLSRAVKSFKPDFIYERYNLFMPAGIWVKNKFGIPLILEVNAPLYQERSKYDGLALKQFARWSERYTWRNADAVLPVTQVLANMIEAQGVDQKIIHVIPNGIDPEKFRNAPTVEEAKEKLGLKGKMVFGFTGFIRKWHGLEKVLDILQKDKCDRHLLLVGDGPGRDAIVDKAKKLGVSEQLTITGIINRENIPDYVSAFDIALQPDVVEYASPLKLFEYLALGKPVVAPIKDNICEILTNGDNAILFSPNSASEFVDSINILCTDNELRKRIMKRSFDTIMERGFTWENNAKLIIKIINNRRAQA